MRILVEVQKNKELTQTRIRLMVVHAYSGQKDEKVLFETQKDFKGALNQDEAKIQAQSMADRLAKKIKEIKSI